MFAFVRGNLFSFENENMVVDTGSVGYHLLVPPACFPEQPKVGEEIFLYTYLQVREDGWQLFGFPRQEQLEIFRHLISVSGIGPRLGLAVLNTLSVRDVVLAVRTGDSDRLSMVPGIGKKTSQRLVLELREKFKKLTAEDQAESQAQAGSENLSGNDVIQALIGLGYSSGEARSAFFRVLQVLGPEAGEAALIKGALKLMAQN